MPLREDERETETDDERDEHQPDNFRQPPRPEYFFRLSHAVSHTQFRHRDTEAQR